MPSRGALHPLIRILCLLALAASLPAQGLPVLCVLLSLLLLAFLRIPGALRRWALGLVRLKWLFLALFVLYLGYTPGEPLWPALPGLSAEGLVEGARRAAVLAILLAAVQALLAVTPTPELVEALRQLLWPLKGIGIDGDRFALRLALVLAGVAAMQQRLGELRSAGGPPLDAAAAVIAQIERAPPVDDPAPQRVALAAPRWPAFLLPLGLAALLWWLGR